MPPNEENLPDFDSMSPEELMAWMETLAERQGATEGFTTEQRVEIAEVDPDSVADTGPGYIPYGMSEEEWAKRQAAEEAAKAERLAQRKAAAPVPPPAPEPEIISAVPETAAPEPAGVMSSAAEDAAPDFDSMSPEELMAWMETLAERQGATEGFTTEQRVEIAEVDPDSVADTGPGYIPYGMSEEEWAKRQATEEAAKAERLARRAAERETQAAESVEQFELPAMDLGVQEGDTTDVAPVSEASPADWLQNLTSEGEAGMPDLSALGDPIDDAADELLDLELPQMDLSALGDDLPDSDFLGIDLSQMDEDAFPELDLSALGDDLPGDDLPQMDLSDLEALTNPSEELVEEEVEDLSDPMEWLEGLAEDEESAFELPTDAVEPAALPQILSDLTSDAEDDMQEAIHAIADPTDEDVDPLEWLESLAKQEGVDDEEFITDAGIDVPLSQQDSQREYTEYSVEAEDMAFDAASMLDSLEEDDPVAWLEGLAAAQNADTPKPAAAAPEPEVEEEEEDALLEDAEAGDIMSQLEQGISDPSTVENWMADLLQKGASRSDIPDYIEEDDDDTELEAQIPDWLVEQVGPPPELRAQAEEDAELDLEIDLEAELDAIDLDQDIEMADIPDWLQEGLAEDDAALDNIFAQAADEDVEFDVEAMTAAVEQAPAEVPAESAAVGIDTSDPWAEAFEQEQALAEGELPAWYREKLAALHAGEAGEEVDTLAEANLPEESSLPFGEVESVPGWLVAPLEEAVSEPEFELEPEPEPSPDLDKIAAAVEGFAPDDESIEIPDEIAALADDEQELAAAELPEWLRTQTEPEGAIGADEELPEWMQQEELPDWLVETAEEPLPEPVSAQMVVEPEPASPAPVVVHDVDVAAALASAREKITASDYDGGLLEYETVIRANTSLGDVVSDIQALVNQERFKSNAAMHRVLGDALMRQGSLQEALDTYRRALNLL